MGKAFKCPNLLFCKWVKEWVDEAKEKGWQSFHTYKKALKSLEKFPMPLKSGAECSILQGFGPKICTQLDRQLAEYAHQFDLSISDALAQGNAALGNTHKPVNLNTHKPVLQGSIHRSDATLTHTSASASCNNQNLERSSSNVRLSTSTDYMPRYRSGGYALLMTLYKNWENNGNGATMNKQDLMREAQNHCDSSFFLPPNDKSHYTAWSSMSTLTHKRFVVKVSNPAKYYLTDEGIELCQKMIEAVNNNGLDASSLSQKSPSKTSKFTSSTVNIVKTSTSTTMSSLNGTEHSVSQSSLLLSQTSSSEKRQYCNESIVIESPLKISHDNNDPVVDLSSHVDDVEILPASLSERLKKSVDAEYYYPPKKVVKLQNAAESNDDYQSNSCSSMAASSEIPRETSSSSLIFSYFSDYHTAVKSKDEAAVSVEDDFGAGFLVMSSYSSLLSSGYRYKLDINGLEFADAGFIFAYLHNENSPELSNWKKEEKIVESIVQTTEISSITDSRKTQSQRYVIVKSSSSSTTTTLQQSVEIEISSQKPSCSSNASEKTDFTVYSQASSLTSGNSECTLESAGSSSADNLLQGGKKAEEKPSVIHLFPPEDYSICLCIDNREHYGMGKVKQKLLPALLKNKVACDVRPLPIGDFLWIAKTPDGREAVLDFVIERKRIDDLASSITDGRFTEQKFRLKRTGIRRVMYLIEMCTGFNNLSLPIDRLLQSITNSQVIDNCDIKIVSNPEETLAFLSLMTKKIQQIYSRKILSVVNFLPTDRTQWGDVAFDYESFNNSAQKTPALSVREMFAKCLLQIKYMTAEKTVAILKKYPTPKSLMSTYDASLSTKEKESLLAEICYKTYPKKTIGAALSKSVFYAYNNM